ncbi:hypothetical protein IQ215_09455 [Cyanobacterium stanieri LEGE 03274]|uniref:Uncharacterized protein n=1 Tax=Cyanobacterium stanieri LEGE 03274 TaxID=1828756 RepID=A0ABR9V4V5_9CHRO|nr:hypothetical protein [Cyanobacterium stanieri]MBE9222918.1 hypothetical protein [Cyanobacterium stanieri LEGE 03274]
MASSEAVKKYLAYWFQLQKPVIIARQNKAILPQKVIMGDRYSVEFERCWNLVSDPATGDCYVQGTTQTIQELLSSKWNISDCARCTMPVPIIEVGSQESSCVCNDLDNWPNNELPSPRQPIENGKALKDIHRRLNRTSQSF